MMKKKWAASLVATCFLGVGVLQAMAYTPPAGFDGFQFNPPYNTQNPFNQEELLKVDSGFQLFNNETFSGNGRTCGSCHIASENYNVSANSLPSMGTVDLANLRGGSNGVLENQEIIDKLGLFHINQSFGAGTEGNVDTPAGPFRASMSIGGLGLTTLNEFVCKSRESTPGGTLCSSVIAAVDDGIRDIMLGWSGDGAPDVMFGFTEAEGVNAEDCQAAIDGFAENLTNLESALNTFTLGAVKTHLTKTQNRTPGIDFRCPTSQELTHMTKFQKWLGRRFELDITQLTFTSPFAQSGRNLFSTRMATCVGCHVNAGASDNQGKVKLYPVPFLTVDGNEDFDFNNNQNEPLKIIGANKASRNGSIFYEKELDDLVAAAISKAGTDLTDFAPMVPYDEGDGELKSGGEPGFNVQSVIEAARKHQFFHNNAIVGDVEDAIHHYFTDKFQLSQGGTAVTNAFRGGKTGPQALEALSESAAVSETEVINRMGFFLRSLSSLYEIADCERLVNEIIDRIDMGLPVDIPQLHCGIALDTAKKMLTDAKVSENDYINLPKRFDPILDRLDTIIFGKKDKQKLRKELKAVANQLKAARLAIAVTPELP